MIKKVLYPVFFAALITSCGGGDDYTYVPTTPELPGNGSDDDDDEEPTITDEELLDLTQATTFKYFWDLPMPIPVGQGKDITRTTQAIVKAL